MVGKSPFLPFGKSARIYTLKEKGKAGKKDSNFRSSDISKSMGSQQGNSLEPWGRLTAACVQGAGKLGGGGLQPALGQYEWHKATQCCRASRNLPSLPGGRE